MREGISDGESYDADKQRSMVSPQPLRISALKNCFNAETAEIRRRPQRNLDLRGSRCTGTEIITGAWSALSLKSSTLGVYGVFAGVSSR
jgi:hypothetical protein